MAQAVSHRPLTVDVHVRTQDSAYENCGGQSGTLTDLSPSTSVSLLGIVPSTLHTHLHLHVELTRRTTTQNMRTFQKAMLFRKFGERWIANYFHNTKEDMTESSVMYALRPKKQLTLQRQLMTTRHAQIRTATERSHQNYDVYGHFLTSSHTKMNHFLGR